MAGPQVIQGSWEDIATHAEDLKGRDDLLLIVPAQKGKDSGAEHSPNLAQAMKDYIGSFDFGDANLSENTGEKFAKLLADKYRKGQQ